MIEDVKGSFVHFNENKHSSSPIKNDDSSVPLILKILAARKMHELTTSLEQHKCNSDKGGGVSSEFEVRLMLSVCSSTKDPFVLLLIKRPECKRRSTIDNHYQQPDPSQPINSINMVVVNAFAFLAHSDANCSELMPQISRKY